MPVYRVVDRRQGQILLRQVTVALWGALGLLLLTIGVCMAGLILLDPEDHAWGIKLFDALWNAVNAVTTLGDFTSFNRDQKGFMLLTLFMFVIVGGYAITNLTGVLSSAHVKTYRENRVATRLLDQLKEHAVVVGFGPIGRLVAAALKARGQQVVVVDVNPEATQEASALGYLAVEGDASADDGVLLQARVGAARGMYITTEDPHRKLTITLMAHMASPGLAICVTGENQARGALLKRAGASEVVVIDSLVAESLLALVEGRKA